MEMDGKRLGFDSGVVRHGTLPCLSGQAQRPPQREGKDFVIISNYEERAVRYVPAMIPPPSTGHCVLLADAEPSVTTTGELHAERGVQSWYLVHDWVISSPKR
jgi:hypothetical protein